MKATVKRVTEKEESISFPFLAECLTSEPGLIVLFSGPKQGVVLASNAHHAWFPGDYDSEWIPCTDKNTWGKFTGEITLSN